jgi:transposase
VDKQGFVIAPLAAASVNKHDMTVFPDSIKCLKSIMKTIDLDLSNTIFNLDSGFDSKLNRALIEQLNIKPNIKVNPRNNKNATANSNSEVFFDQDTYNLRFVVERTFAWEDKFRRLIIRWERIHKRHLAFHLIAFTLINLRHFCGS